MTTNSQSFYSTMVNNQNENLFNDQEIQRFDADTIKNRYGESWRNFVSNVREVTQPDGSIVKEYIIEDPSLLEEMKSSSSRPMDSISSTTISDDEQQPLKNKFAQIKAKFEQKNYSNVFASPSISTANSSHTGGTSARQNTRKQMDDLYARHRRVSNESIPIQQVINENNQKNHLIDSSNQSTITHNTYNRSQSIGSERSKISSFRRFNSADEADEEVSRIHRQGEELRRQKQDFYPTSTSNQMGEQSRAQYEILDEDGNPIMIDNVQDLIKMSGARAREVPQPDGTVIKEYVIDDPQVLSQFRSQQESSPMSSSYIEQRNINQDAPPPPPRMPLRAPVLFRQGSSSTNDNLPYSIQQIHVIEPQRRYEYLTTNGRRIQFFIANSENFNEQILTDLDIRELTNAINLRIVPNSNPIIQQQPRQQQGQPSSTEPTYNQPKPWYPAVDLSQRQRLGSDSQSYSNNQNIGFQQIQNDLSRSASSGALNQGSYYRSQNPAQVYNEPTQGWHRYRYQDSHNQRQQNNETFQTSAQFLPQQQQQQQTTRSTYSPPINTHQQSTTTTTAYPYQGQQQHGVRILNDFNQQRTATINDRRARI